jgi:hypothetical protein
MSFQGPEEKLQWPSPGNEPTFLVFKHGGEAISDDTKEATFHRDFDFGAMGTFHLVQLTA